MRKGAALLLALLAAVPVGCAHSGRFRPARVAGDRELDYPLSAQIDRLEGEVTTVVFVNREGKPEEVKIIQSSGYDVLDSAAYRFVTTLNFVPAAMNDKPVDSWTRLVLRYKLTDIPFDEKRWLDEVTGLQSQIRTAATAAEREALLKKLYVRYVGLSTFTAKNPRLSINDAVRRVCLKKTNEHWADLADVLPLSFAVYDDFLRRYPDSELSERVKEDLIRHLNAAKAEVRVAAFSSSRTAHRAPALIEIIEKRLNELGAMH